MSITEIIKKKFLLIIIRIGVNILGLIYPRKAASIALDIFRTPRKGRLKPYQKEFLSQFKNLVISSIEGDVMTYDNEKDGPKVLLAHGWESNSYRWKKLLQYLSSLQINIVMMDAPAHGASQSDKFDALKYVNMMQAVCNFYQPEIMIGHSVGGYSSLIFVGDRKPPSLKHLIILASADKLTDITTRYFQMVGYSQRVRAYYDMLVKEIWKYNIDHFSAAKFSQKIDIPGLIIHDKSDDINLFYEGEAINDHWEKSTFVATEGYGHSLQNRVVYRYIKDYIFNAISNPQSDKL